jgi:hypothetical protein
MTDSCLNYLNAPLHMPLAYTLESGSLALFGHPSSGDRLNCGSSELYGEACRALFVFG